MEKHTESSHGYSNKQRIFSRTVVSDSTGIVPGRGRYVPDGYLNLIMCGFFLYFFFVFVFLFFKTIQDSLK